MCRPRSHESTLRIACAFWLGYCFSFHRWLLSNNLLHRPTWLLPVPQMAAEAALVQMSPSFDGECVLSGNALISKLSVEIDVAVPIRKFRVRNLLSLAQGVVIASQWKEGEDMPLGTRGAQLAWTEFEVVNHRLAIRITRLV